MKRRWYALLALGLAQITADLCGLELARAAAAATAASPAPKVFTRVGALEPFSARFALRVVGRDGSVQRVALTPERYARLLGPYNRRNAFGAAIAAAPELSRTPLTRPLFRGVARHALCGPAPALRELGVATDGVDRVFIEHSERPPARTVHVTEVVCP